MTDNNLNLEFDKNGNLVDPKEEKRESIAYLQKDKAIRLSEFLKYSEISDVDVTYDKISDTYHVTVLSEDFEKAANLYDVFAQNELDNDAEKNVHSETSDVNLYESSKEKYSDVLSSAIAFFICGGAGLIILLLNDLGILNFLSKDSSSFIFMNIVLIALFAGFIFIGFLSVKSAKKIKINAEKEDEALHTTMNWLNEHVLIDEIEGSYDNSIPEEMKYFNRSEYIQTAIKKEFPDFDEATVEFVSDKYIETLFSH